MVDGAKARVLVDNGDEFHAEIGSVNLRDVTVIGYAAFETGTRVESVRNREDFEDMVEALADDVVWSDKK